LPKGGKCQYLDEDSRKPSNLSQKTRKDQISKKLAPKLKKIKINSTNSKLNCKKSCLDHAKKPDLSVSYGLKVKNMTIRVLLDSGSSGDLLFVKKGSIKHISIARQAVPQSWGTSNSTLVTDKVGDIEISFVEYPAS
jgi:hypothetical protein